MTRDTVVLGCLKALMVTCKYSRPNRTSNTDKEGRRQSTGNSRIQSGVPMFSSPPYSNVFTPHSIRDAPQLRKEGVIVSYLSTETLPHA